MTIGLGLDAGVAAPSAITLVALIPAVLVDVLDQRLPDRMVATAGAVTALSASTMAVLGRDLNVVGAGIGMLGVGIPLLTMHLISPSSMGFGDVKVGIVIGLGVGFTDPRLALVTLFVASGATAAAALFLRRRSIAFGPGLVGAAMLSLTIPAVAPTTMVSATDILLPTQWSMHQDVAT